MTTQTTPPTSEAFMWASLGPIATPQHQGHLWLGITTDEDVPGWRLRSVPTAGDTVEAPIWALLPNDRALELARSRAARQGHVPPEAIPSLKDLGLVDRIEPLAGITLNRVELTTQPDMPDWHFAQIRIREVAHMRRERRAAYDASSDLGYAAIQNAIVLTANNHPVIRRLAVTHILHGVETEDDGLTLMFEPWE